jgi:hypothetical protein
MEESTMVEGRGCQMEFGEWTTEIILIMNIKILDPRWDWEEII